MWHWMRVSVRVSHRGWKLATSLARIAIGVPDYAARLPCDGRAAASGEPLAAPEQPARPHRLVAAAHRDGGRAGVPG